MGKKVFEKALKDVQDQHQKKIDELEAEKDASVKERDVVIEKLDGQIAHVRDASDENGAAAPDETSLRAERDQLQQQLTDLRAEKHDAVKAINDQLQDLQHCLEEREKEKQAAQIQHEKEVAELQGQDTSTKAIESQLHTVRTELEESEMPRHAATCRAGSAREAIRRVASQGEEQQEGTRCCQRGVREAHG